LRIAVRLQGGPVFNFCNLDELTRAHMLAEFEYDVSQEGGLYYSKRFTDEGRTTYPALMRKAITSGTEVTLAEELNRRGCMKAGELRKGVPVGAPYTAAQTFADGEFNRFYSRGVCLRAFDHGSNEVEVYRAKHSVVPREESIALIGKRLPASTFLDDFRVNVGLETALGLPRPNSGLSIFCGCGGCPAS
jgi:hypothetical protein